MNLVESTIRGLYCAVGDFFIDPWQPVDKAIITHAHSDHAKPGSKNYLCHTNTEPLLKLRLGNNNYESLAWNQPVYINGVSVSLHPAGHIVGSSQVRIEYKGEVWVVSGDYKLENDGISGKFEPVRCHSFITETTFGLPIYRWKPQAEIYSDIQHWIQNNRESGKTSVLIAYSLGKAQRVLHAVKPTTDRVFAHGAVSVMHNTILSAGMLNENEFPEVQRITPETPKHLLKGSVILAPPSAQGSPWMRRFLPYSLGISSGWMQVRGNQRRKNADAGFVLSDHCDWEGILKAVQWSGAEKVLATHGFQSVIARYFREAGLDAGEIRTEFDNAEEELSAGEAGLQEDEMTTNG